MDPFLLVMWSYAGLPGGPYFAQPGPALSSTPVGAIQSPWQHLQMMPRWDPAMMHVHQIQDTKPPCHETWQDFTYAAHQQARCEVSLPYATPGNYATLYPEQWCSHTPSHIDQGYPLVVQPPVTIAQSGYYGTYPAQPLTSTPVANYASVHGSLATSDDGKPSIPCEFASQTEAAPYSIASSLLTPSLYAFANMKTPTTPYEYHAVGSSDVSAALNSDIFEQ